MSLSEEQVKALLAIKPKTRTKKDAVDLTTVESRDQQTWFKLPHRMQTDNGEVQHCDNPNCNDPRVSHEDTEAARKQGTVVAMIGDKRICRYCFLEGWLTVIDGQAVLN